MRNIHLKLTPTQSARLSFLTTHPFTLVTSVRVARSNLSDVTAVIFVLS
jgi:hypothetical protein